MATLSILAAQSIQSAIKSKKKIMLGEEITYDYGNGLLGIEEYLPGNRVRWAFEGDTCLNGTWFQDGAQICFVYETDPEGPQCWTFHHMGTGIRARFAGDPNGADLSEVAQSPSPLRCAGPDTGV